MLYRSTISVSGDAVFPRDFLVKLRTPRLSDCAKKKLRIGGLLFNEWLKLSNL